MLLMLSVSLTDLGN